MIRKDMVSFLANETNLPHSVCIKLIHTLPEMIRAGLESDGNVLFPYLGKFELKTRKARKGRNPKTGEVIEIPEKKVVSFKPAPSFAKSFGEDAE